MVSTWTPKSSANSLENRASLYFKTASTWESVSFLERKTICSTVTNLCPHWQSLLLLVVVFS